MPAIKIGMAYIYKHCLNYSRIQGKGIFHSWSLKIFYYILVYILKCRKIFTDKIRFLIPRCRYKRIMVQMKIFKKSILLQILKLMG